eukprot:g5728.t1 g5728   contig2:1183108-1183566(-)
MARDWEPPWQRGSAALSTGDANDAANGTQPHALHRSVEVNALTTPGRRAKLTQSCLLHDAEELTATLRSSTQTTVQRQVRDLNSGSAAQATLRHKRHFCSRLRAAFPKRIQNQNDWIHPKFTLMATESSSIGFPEPDQIKTLVAAECPVSTA